MQFRYKNRTPSSDFFYFCILKFLE